MPTIVFILRRKRNPLGPSNVIFKKGTYEAGQAHVIR
jgi:hypothetical protein